MYPESLFAPTGININTSKSIRAPEMLFQFSLLFERMSYMYSLLAKAIVALCHCLQTYFQNLSAYAHDNISTLIYRYNHQSRNTKFLHAWFVTIMGSNIKSIIGSPNIIILVQSYSPIHTDEEESINVITFKKLKRSTYK